MLPLLAMLGSAVGAAGAAGAGATMAGEMGAGLLGVMDNITSEDNATADAQMNAGPGPYDRMMDKKNKVDAMMANAPQAVPISSLGQSRVKYGQQPWEDYQSKNLGMGGY